VWATDAYFRPALARQLSSSQIVFLEDAIITLCFIPLLIGRRQNFKGVSRRSWVALTVFALGPQAIATVLFTRSLGYAFPASGPPDLSVANEVYFLYLLQPIIGISLAWLILRERRKPYFWPLAAIAMCGVYLIVFSQDPLAPLSAAQHPQLVAGLLSLGAVCLWAAGTVLGRYALAELPFMETAGLRFLLALPVLAVLVMFDHGPSGLTHYSLTQIPSFVGIALIPGVVGMLLYYRALSATPASLAAVAELGYPCALFLVFSLPPPVGLGAPLTGLEIVGAVLLAAAVTSLNVLKEQRIVEVPYRHEVSLASEPSTS